MASKKETPDVTAFGSAAAPFIYFDGVVTLGAKGDIIQLELAANTVEPTSENGTRTDTVVVAHIRCSKAAAVDLRDAINKALLLGAKTEGEAN